MGSRRRDGARLSAPNVSVKPEKQCISQTRKAMYQSNPKSNVSVKPEKQGSHVTWSSVAGADKYILEGAPDDDLASSVVIYLGADLQYHHSQPYQFYRVRAMGYKEFELGPWSRPVQLIYETDSGSSAAPERTESPTFDIETRARPAPISSVKTPQTPKTRPDSQWLPCLGWIALLIMCAIVPFWVMTSGLELIVGDRETAESLAIVVGPLCFITLFGGSLFALNRLWVGFKA